MSKSLFRVKYETKVFNSINQLRFFVDELIFSKAFQKTGVVFTGNIIASGFSLITILLLSRTLGPETFGMLSLVGSVIILMVSLTDLGIAVGISKFVVPLNDKSSKKAVSYFRTAFRIEILLGFATILVGLIFLDSIVYWLGGIQIKGPLVLGFIIAGILSFYAYIPIVLQALQKFWTITFLNVFSNLLKLIIVATLFYTGYLTLWNALYVNLFAALTILLVGLLVIPRFFLKKINWREDVSSAAKLFSFTKWLAISYGLNAVASRLDILLLSHFRSSAEVGHYALAFQLSSSLPLLLGAVSTVLIPKVSAYKTQDQLGKYILKNAKSALLIIPLAFIGMIIAPWVIQAFFGSKFVSSVPVLQILILNYSLILIVNPVSYVLYALEKQYLLTFMNAVTLITLFAMQIFLIPNLGGIGAALALLFNTIIAILILTPILILFFKQGKIRI